MSKILKSMIKSVIETLRYIIIEKIYTRVWNINNLRKWAKNGMKGPTPPYLKQKIVKEYAKIFSIDVLIETGTFGGNMVNATKRVFNRIYSIELDKTLYQKAKMRFSRYNHITLFQGDSSKILPKILPDIISPCVFWLDAHFSGGITAKGELETPIKKELEHILNISNLNHVILIDDANLFIGKNDYPTINELKTMVFSKRPDFTIIVKKNIIRIHKKYSL